MEAAVATSVALSLVFVSIIVRWAWSLLDWVWFKPKKLERCLRQQGFKGNAYRLFYGDMKENAIMVKEAKSKPMNLSTSHDISPRVIPLLDQTVKTYGKNSFVWVGPVPRVNIMNPEDLKDVFAKPSDFPKPVSNPLIKLLATGLANYEGEKWAKHRRIINPTFHSEKVKRMLPAFYQSCNDMIKEWETVVSKEGSSCEFDVWPSLQNLTADVISRTAFGSSYQEGQKIFELLKEQAVYAMKTVQRVYIPGWRFVPTKMNKRMKQIHEEIRGLVEGIINKREQAIKAGEATKDDLLGALLESNMKDIQDHGKNNKNIGMSIEDVIEDRNSALTVTTTMASLNEETAKKVLRQVEFYFSDSNLPRDEFLKKSISESEDGMISLALICSFSRMRGHLGLGDLKADAIPEDSVKAVAETLRKSTTLKISEDGQKVGRATEILKPEEVIEQVDIRTVAAAPLEFAVKLEDVETFFGQFGKVNSVRLPRHVADKKLFCGTALVEFSTEEDANKILTETLNYGGVQLELKPKKKFDTERAKETEEYEKTRPLTNSNCKNKAKPEEDYPKGLIVAFTLKSSSDKDSAEKNGTPEETKKEAGDVNAEDGEKDNKENVDEKNSLDGEEKKTEDGEKPSEGVKEGEKEEKLNAVETYKDNMDVVMREDLKILFGKFGTVKYIDFKIGEVSGFVRFEEPEAAHKARAAAVLTELGGLVVKNFIATLEPVSGEAEKEYWKNFRGSQEKFRESKGGNRGRGGKYHRGGHKHGRSRDDNNGGRQNKHRKF